MPKSMLDPNCDFNKFFNTTKLLCFVLHIFPYLQINKYRIVWHAFYFYYFYIVLYLIVNNMKSSKQEVKQRCWYARK